MINETRNPNKASEKTGDAFPPSHTRSATLSELDQRQTWQELTKDDLLLAEIRKRQMVNLAKTGKDCLCGLLRGMGLLRIPGTMNNDGLLK